MHAETSRYNASLTPGDRAICDRLAREIDRALPEAENRIWHAHPVWFLDGNPVVGYSKLKDGVRLLFWSGQSFDEEGLRKEGRFKAAEARFITIGQIHGPTLKRWLGKARDIQWDYRNIVKRKGRLERVKGKPAGGFTAEEREAMKARTRELRDEARQGKDRADGERAVRDAIGKMPEPDRRMARRLHDLVTANAPDLVPRTWYGMPAWARNDKVVCFFQAATKFKTRYATLGFTDQAALDEGDMWPSAFALKDLTAAGERRIVTLLRQAVGADRSGRGD